MINPKKQGLLVYIIRRESQCNECSRELWKGSFITLAGDRGALCLTCADFDHLLYLPAGDAALTRRSTKHSKLHAKVLQWSRTRKRYERQGVLVEEAALEQECLADADARARMHERNAKRRAELDEKYVAEFERHLLEQFPRCPAKTASAITQHACRKHSGRVGRSAAAKEFDAQAILLAVQAHVRHVYTEYDELLLLGYDRHEARALVKGSVQDILAAWMEVG